MTDCGAYPEFFQRLTGRTPYDYQLRVAAELFSGRNVVLRAPTGAGKTWAVLAPFLRGIRRGSSMHYRSGPWRRACARGRGKLRS